MKKNGKRFIKRALKIVTSIVPLKENQKNKLRNNSSAQEEIARQIEKDFAFDEKTYLIFQHQFFDRAGNKCYNGGAERYVRDLADIITAMGYRAVLLQAGEEETWERKVENLQIIGVPSKDYSDYTQVINNFSVYFCAVYSGIVCWGQKLLHPNIMISHGVSWDIPHKNVNPQDILRIFSDVDHFVSVDLNTISWLRATFAKTMAGKKMIYIPNYVDTQKYQPVAKKNKRIKVCFPRRAAPERGYWLISSLLPSIIDKYPHCDFDFVGFPHGEEIENDIKNLISRFPSRVNHYVVEPDEMVKIYQQVDISLIPTLYAEGTSLSCLEAQACGNVVIATNIGGLPNLIIDGYNGFLINPDGKELMAALDKVLTQPMLVKRISTNAIEVAKAFDKKTWEFRWQGVLEKLTEGNLQLEGTEFSRLVINYREDCLSHKGFFEMNKKRPLYKRAFSFTRNIFFNPKKAFKSIRRIVYNLYNSVYDKAKTRLIIRTLNESVQKSKKPLVVYVSYFDWYASLTQRPHHMYKILAGKGFPVVFCGSKTRYMDELQKNLYIINPKILKTIVESRLLKVLNFTYGSPLEDYKIDDGTLVLYELIDDFELHMDDDVIKKQSQRFQNLLLREKNWTLVSANSLYETALKWGAPKEKILLSRNAVNVDDFLNKQISVPAVMQKIIEKKKPIIGYYGALTCSWFDFELLLELVQRCPQWEFVVIGLLCQDKNIDDTLGFMKKLEKYSNFTYIPPVPYKDLPAYANHFSVATILFQMNEITKGTSPVKLFEYMALGLPIVSTPLPECKLYNSVLIADGVKEFAEKIQEAMQRKSDTEYQELLKKEAAENTWEARVDDIIRIIEREIC